MIGFLILVASIGAAVLSSRFYAKRGYSTRMRRFGAVSTGVLVLLLGVLVFGPRGEPTATDAQASAPKLEDRSSYAYVICEDAVRDQLRSPSTADFPWTPDMSRMVTGDDKRYVIIGHVNAQNGFGATIRADWSCEATYKDNGFGEADNRSWETKVAMQSR